MKQKILDLINAAKRTDPETGSFAEWLAEYLVANGVTVQEWIPVEERLPKKYVILDYDHSPAWLEFVVMIDGAEVSTSLCFDGKNFFDDNDGQIYDVTHWMERPEPPRKDVSGNA